MTEPEWKVEEDCGCKRADNYSLLCPRHWNEAQIRYELERCQNWMSARRLKPEDPYDRRVLRYLDQVAYWAAKAATEAGGHA